MLIRFCCIILTYIPSFLNVNGNITVLRWFSVLFFYTICCMIFANGILLYVKYTQLLSNITSIGENFHDSILCYPKGNMKMFKKILPRLLSIESTEKVLFGNNNFCTGTRKSKIVLIFSSSSRCRGKITVHFYSLVTTGNMRLAYK